MGGNHSMRGKALLSLAVAVVPITAVTLLLVLSHEVHAGTPGAGGLAPPTGDEQQPPPPPPPPAGVLGGPLAGLNVALTDAFNRGYFDFNIKWDPVRGLGPVFTQPGCFNCHGGGSGIITNCAFNPPGVACVDGGSSTILGVRYGKWNSDGTFNYLDGSGTFPEDEGGPTQHVLSVSKFKTLEGCSLMTIAGSPNGARESGTTVTILTTANHHFTVGENVAISRVGNSGYDGNFTILSTPGPATFTYTGSLLGLGSSGGGNADVMPPEAVPSDATVVSSLRSPELYGLGLIDSIPESTILANSGVYKGMGITGVANMVPDQNGELHVGRFGQKATFPNLLMFTAFAFNNEIGVTNAFFPEQHLPSGQSYPPACGIDANEPEDVDGNDFLEAYQFNELLAPVAPQPPNDQTVAGKAVFEAIGCNLCHIESMKTGPNIRLATDLNGGMTGVVGPLSNATVNLYSDLLLHDMGPGLSGGIPFQPEQMGQATLTEWRTAPLWGLSTRIALGLLHNNRATDLNSAILAHRGEATEVISAYKSLSPTDLSNLLAFLSSL
jgi:Di-haem oxidoreductase, putative peroxidase